MNAKKLETWKKFLTENVNFSALRLLFAKQTDAEIRAALDWEMKHR